VVKQTKGAQVIFLGVERIKKNEEKERRKRKS
jgi:hypothetical protein